VSAYCERLAGWSAVLFGFAPGIACVGYTFGLGSIAKLGAASSWGSLCVIALSGFVFWALLAGSGRLAGATGGSVLRAWCQKGPIGAGLAVVVIIGLLGAQWSGLPLLTHQLARLLQATLELAWPALPHSETVARVGLAGCLIGFAALCLRPRLRERLWAILLALMILLGLGLLGAMALTSASWSEQLAPGNPLGDPRALALAVIPLAIPTFLVRPWLLGDRVRDERAQRRDAAVGAWIFFAVCLMTWLVCLGLGSDGAVAAMVQQMLGTGDRFAGGFFLVAALAAGLTSVLPMIVAVPVMVADCRGRVGGLEGGISVALIAMASGLALGGLAYGDRVGAWHRLTGQVAQVLIPPCVIGGLLCELNFGDAQGSGGRRWLDAGLVIALAFATVAAAAAATKLLTIL
jgi:hypothetical protein